jgi:hypothetical protein
MVAATRDDRNTGMNSEIEALLLERGWVAIDLPDPSPVRQIREQLLSGLRGQFQNLSQIEHYHTLSDDDRHISTVHEISQKLWHAKLGYQIIAANLELFQRLIGPDLHVQQYPYLRVVRPGRREDAVPLHRDTYYGASPFEVSVVVPFTDMGADSALRAIPGSHLEPDKAYPFTQTLSETVKFKSVHHQLGYAYAPRLLDPSVDTRAEPMLARVGQALIFGLSLIHGGGINSSSRTRFSMDIRVVNSFAPVNFHRGVHTDYYIPLCSSPISRSAQRFLTENDSSRSGQPEPCQ